MGALDRAVLLIGSENIEKLSKASVALFGVGGVGGFAAEALARSGVGAITVFDNDTVAESNLNRQIIARADNIGEDKIKAVTERLLSINPALKLTAYKEFYLPATADKYDLSGFDCVLDAVDTVSAKIEIISRAKNAGVPVISCMGTGGKTDPTLLRVADIEKTSECPLARVMRRELKKRGVKKLKVVYSNEKPTRPLDDMSISCRTNCVCPPGAKHKCTERRDIPGSVAFVPSVAGLILAGEIIKDLTTSPET